MWTGRRNALSVCMLGIVPLSVAPVLVGDEVGSPSIQASMDPTTRYIWAVSLFVGCVVALIGIFHPDDVKGLILEMGGCALVTTPAVLFGVAALDMRGGQALVAAGFGLGFGLACFVRTLQCRRILRRASRQ